MKLHGADPDSLNPREKGWALRLWASGLIGPAANLSSAWRVSNHLIGLMNMWTGKKSTRIEPPSLTEFAPELHVLAAFPKQTPMQKLAVSLMRRRNA